MNSLSDGLVFADQIPPLWAELWNLGTEFVHLEPHINPKACVRRPETALKTAIMDCNRDRFSSRLGLHLESISESYHTFFHLEV